MGLMAIYFCTVPHKYAGTRWTSRILCEMVQNRATEARARGRPRAYDPQTALQQARDAFWRYGYAQTSLDTICAAVSMNRPSVYAAFGDKHALYCKALDDYWHQSLAMVQEALRDETLPLGEVLRRAYDGQLTLYFAPDGLPRGCFAIGTAVTEAVEDPAIRASLAEGIRALDADFERRIRAAQDRGELRSDADATALAWLASATLHSIAIRARSGATRTELREMADKAAVVICG